MPHNRLITLIPNVVLTLRSAEYKLAFASGLCIRHLLLASTHDFQLILVSTLSRTGDETRSRTPPYVAPCFPWDKTLHECHRCESIGSTMPMPPPPGLVRPKSRRWDIPINPLHPIVHLVHGTCVPSQRFCHNYDTEINVLMWMSLTIVAKGMVWKMGMKWK